MQADLFKHLNKQQKEAVSSVEGPSIILAGAGSGKTRVLIFKVLNLVVKHHISPHSIVMITFTNKAANEMKQRIRAYEPFPRQDKQASLGYVGTFHSFCNVILRKNGDRIGIDLHYVIYDDDDQKDLMKSILKKMNIRKFTPSYYLNRISEVYQNYQRELEKNNALDFDDLIMRTVELFSQDKQVLEKYQEKYPYLLVDEFQDTNYAQYVFTKLLSQKHRNIAVVGDFSQSIYSWRGADIRNLEKFKEDFPEAKIFHLERNYRSTQKILDFAYDVISKNQTHPILNLFTDNTHGEDIRFYQASNEEDEAIFVARELEKHKSEIPYNECAILYRINAQSRVLEETFLHFGIPYMLIGGIRFYERKEIKDILSYLRLLINPLDEVSRDRIEKLGKKRWELFKKVQETYTKENNLSTVDLMEMLFKTTYYLDLYNPDDPEDYSRLENIKELKSVALNFPD
ncbi:UvrD-helicase domain-containing protein, partial [Candidatus Roizmanbacteria bacterium]|nr:UvrD-helicase domain-containing protein [Candidatus Roizmanbacteria bacterium]